MFMFIEFELVDFQTMNIYAYKEPKKTNNEVQSSFQIESNKRTTDLLRFK